LKYYLTKQTSQFWSIEVIQNTHLITYGNIGEKGISETTHFQNEYDAKNDAKKQTRLQHRKGYEVFVSVPENLFLDRSEDSIYGEEEAYDYFGETPFILVDLADKNRVVEAMEEAFQYIKNYLVSGKREFDNESPEAIRPVFFVEDPDGDEEEPIKEIDFFGEVLSCYPDLENKVIEWIDFAIELKHDIYTNEGYASYLFYAPAIALCYHDPKHFDKFLRYLHTWDWGHETEEENFIFTDLLSRFGEGDESLKVMAARCHSLCGQHGAEFDLSLYLHKNKPEQLDRFFQFLLLNFLTNNLGEIEETIIKYEYPRLYKALEDKVDWFIHRILEQLGIEYDKERMILAVGSIDRLNPHKLSDILNPDYEIPLPLAFQEYLKNREG